MTKASLGLVVFATVTSKLSGQLSLVRSVRALTGLLSRTKIKMMSVKWVKLRGRICEMNAENLEN